MSVGIDGHIGKPMIREGKGLDIYVRRSLRDVFKKVPTLSLEVKVLFIFVVLLKFYWLFLYHLYGTVCSINLMDFILIRLLYCIVSCLPENIKLF